MSDQQPATPATQPAQPSTTAAAPAAAQNPQKPSDGDEQPVRYVTAQVSVGGLNAGQSGWVADDDTTAALIDRGLLEPATP